MKITWYVPRYILISSLFTVISCKENYTPKPRDYIRIDFPEKTYKRFQSIQGYEFELPVYADVKPDTLNHRNGWMNIEFSRFNGTVYLSYVEINNDPEKHINASRDLAYKHTIKAESIREILINRPEHKVYGIFYDIRGDAASPVQFFVTDSTTNFLRGSLYFNVQPNQDSLAPVISFLRNDIDHLLKTLEWKK